LKFLFAIALACSLSANQLTVSQRAEPRTLNPAVAIDNPSRELISLLLSDLVHINRETLKTEPALAESWKVSPDGRTIEVTLRKGLRFSDGVPLTVEDVLFSFAVYLDEKVASPHRDLLHTMQVKRVNDFVLRFEFQQPHAPAERVFDSLFILPRHKLEVAYRSGQLRSAWGVAAFKDIVGTGPFKPVQYKGGDRAVFERNPYYWKRDGSGKALPLLDQLTMRFLADQDAEALQFQSGSLDLLSRVPAKTFAALEKNLKPKGYQFLDAGPGLEYHFLFFNLNQGPKVPQQVKARQQWFQKEEFRRAISLAVDRDAVRQLVYAGRAASIFQPVSPGNKLWFEPSLPRPRRSVDQAKALLRNAGFRWNSTGQLVSQQNQPVEFTVALNAANGQHRSIATLLERDLSQIGISMKTVALEFRSLVDRILNQQDYDAAIMALVSGDADPGPEMSVWLADGKSHFWNLNATTVEGTEKQIDTLMRQQMTTVNPSERKALYKQVQTLAQQSMPLICLVSPHILTIAKPGLRQIGRGIMPPYSFSRIDQMFWEKP
jgi:peptide/nickel transport system substrate-binding protein